jgi:hypothetical protein
MKIEKTMIERAKSNDQGRPNINRVYYDSVRNYLAVTNGVIVATTPVELAEGEVLPSMGIPAQAINEARKHNGVLKLATVEIQGLVVEHEKAVVTTSGQSFRISEVNFPDVEKIIEDNIQEGTRMKIAIDADQLYKLMLAVNDNTVRREKNLIRLFIDTTDLTKPIGVKGNRGRGAIMPCLD